MTKSCQARQYSDQMQCARCGLAWDVNDPEPPECRTDEQINRQQGREVLDGLKTGLSEREHQHMRAKVIKWDVTAHVLTAEDRARAWADLLPIGPERDNAIEVAEALHELGCRL